MSIAAMQQAAGENVTIGVEVGELVAVGLACSLASQYIGWQIDTGAYQGDMKRVVELQGVEHVQGLVDTIVRFEERVANIARAAMPDDQVTAGLRELEELRGGE